MRNPLVPSHRKLLLPSQSNRLLIQFRSRQRPQKPQPLVLPCPTYLNLLSLIARFVPSRLPRARTLLRTGPLSAPAGRQCTQSITTRVPRLRSKKQDGLVSLPGELKRRLPKVLRASWQLNKAHLPKLSRHLVTRFPLRISSFTSSEQLSSNSLHQQSA